MKHIGASVRLNAGICITDIMSAPGDVEITHVLFPFFATLIPHFAFFCTHCRKVHDTKEEVCFTLSL